MATEADLQVKIGADASNLANALNAARRNTNDFVQEFKANSDNLNSSLGSLNARLTAIEASTRQAADAARSLKSYADTAAGFATLYAAIELVKTGISGLVGLWQSELRLAVDGAVGIKNLGVALLDYAKAAAYTQGPAIGMRTANEGALATYGQLFVRLSDYADYLSLGRSAELQTAEASVFLSGKLADVNEAAKAGGFVDGLSAMQHFTAELTKMGLGVKEASDLEARFAEMPGYTTKLNDTLIQTVGSIAKTKEEAVTLGNKLQDLFSNIDARGGGFLAGLHTDRGNQLKEEFDEAQKMGDSLHEQSVTLKGLVEMQRQARDLAGMQANHILEESKNWGILSGLVTWYNTNFNSIVTDWEKMRPAMNESIEGVISAQRGLDNMKASADALRESAVNAGLALAKALNLPVGQIEAADAAVNRLAGALRDLNAAAGEGGGTAFGMTSEATQRAALQLQGALDKAKNTQVELNNQINNGSHYEQMAARIAEERAAGTNSELTNHRRLAAAARQDAAELAEGSAKQREANLKALGEEAQQRTTMAAHDRSVREEEVAGFRRARDAATAALDPQKQAAQIHAANIAELQKEFNTETDIVKKEQLKIQIIKEGAAAQRDAAAKAKEYAGTSGSVERTTIQERADQIRERYKEELLLLKEKQDLETMSASEASTKRIEIIRRESAEIASNFDEQLAAAKRTNAADLEGYTKLQRAKEKALLEFQHQVVAEQVNSVRQAREDAQTVVDSMTGGLQGAITSALSGKRPWKGLTDALREEIVNIATSNIKAVLTSSLASLGIADAIKGVISGSSLGGMFSGILGGGAAAGGAAAGGAAASGGFFSSIMSFLPSLAILDAGAWELPSKGNVDGKGGWPAIVHPGEMVIPAGPAAALRGVVSSGQGGLGGGGDVHNHHYVFSPQITAMDGQDVAGFFQRNGRDLFRSFGREVRYGAALGGSGY